MQTHKGIGLLAATANQRRHIMAEVNHPDYEWRRETRLRRAYQNLADSVSARLGLRLSWERGRPDGDIAEDKEFMRVVYPEVAI